MTAHDEALLPGGGDDGDDLWGKLLATLRKANDTLSKAAKVPSLEDEFEPWVERGEEEDEP